MIEKILKTIENDLPLNNICFGSQAIPLVHCKDIKTCFVSVLEPKFKCRYTNNVNDIVYCNFPKEKDQVRGYN